MEGVFYYAASGAVIGTTLSLLPSPLLALLISQTLSHGRSEGVKIALVPSLTDVPIIAFSMILFTKLSHPDYIFAALSISGAAYLSWIAYKNFRSSGMKTAIAQEKPKSISKGVVTNFLNPNPYIFWITIGIPVIVRGWKSGIEFPLAYLASFFICLIGIRIAVSFAVYRCRSVSQSRHYHYFTKVLSVVLLVFAGKILVQGIHFLSK